MLLMKIVILFIHTNLKKRNWNKCALRCNLFKSTTLLSVEETSCLRMLTWLMMTKPKLNWTLFIYPLWAHICDIVIKNQECIEKWLPKPKFKCYVGLMPERRFLKLPFWYYFKKTTILYACILFERLIDAPPSYSINTMTKP